MKRLEDTDMSRLGPHVKKIKFMIPLRSWTLEYDTFKETVVAQAVSKHYHWNGRIFHCLESAGPDGRQQYLYRNRNGVAPFSEEQLLAGFQAHCAEAEAAKTLLHSDALRAAWTRALKTLPRARSFCFSSSEKDEEWADSPPPQPDCVVRSDPHYCLRGSYWKALAVVGDAVFATGIACLSKAGIEVEALKVACAMTTSFAWEDLPGWKSLNLTSMRRLKFEPQNGSEWSWGGAYYNDSVDEHDLPHVNTPNSYEAVAQRANKAITSVMKKSARHLEYFRYRERDGPMQWPSEEVVTLPRLLCLEFIGGIINPGDFKTWMAGMPLLQELYMSLLGVNGPFSGWLNIFDAIRDHPKSMRVYFDQVETGSYTELSLKYDTGDYEKYLDMPRANDWLDDNYRSLSLYLSGKGRYDRVLRSMLEADDEDADVADDAEDGVWDDGDLADESWDDDEVDDEDPDGRNSDGEESDDENSGDEDLDGKGFDDEASKNH